MLSFLALACAPSTEDTATTPEPSDTSTSGPTTSPPLSTDPLEGLPTGVDQWNALCAKGYTDPVSEAFCAGDEPPQISSFAALRTLLDLGGDTLGGESTLRATAVFHSTALGARFVTPLNPRVFLLKKPEGVVNPVEPNPDETYTVIAFARGEPFVELAAKDPVTEEPRFFLFRFTLPCEDAGCTAADLLTSATESGWTDWSLYDDASIGNTTLDCLRCHQPAGPTGPRLLLMQELRNPWNHWFYEELPANLAAIRTFEAAHGTTRYADLPANLFTDTRPSNLQILVQNNTGLNQPNEYPSVDINEQLEATGRSEVWETLYASSVAGDHKPVPYAGNPQVDGRWDFTEPYNPQLAPDSPVAAVLDAYLGLVAGALAPQDMPDLQDMWFPEALTAIGYHPQPDLDGEGLLRQTCRGCHNSALDPTLTRARFDVDALATMSRKEKDEAISRLGLDDADARKMPPSRFTVLTEAERQLMIEALSP